MLENFKDYIHGINVPQPVIERMSIILKQFNGLFLRRIDYIFLSETPGNAGARDFSSLWLRGEDALSECKSFMINDQIDFVGTRKKISYVDVRTSNFTIDNEPLSNSSMAADVSWDTTLNASFWATGKNCTQLVRLTKDLIKSMD